VAFGLSGNQAAVRDAVRKLGGAEIAPGCLRRAVTVNGPTEMSKA
jgi:hypothetical protein